jgi:hypothetical protein
VSLVSMGNPYVFVRARDLGVTSREALFADDPALFQTLVGIKRAAAARWGWPETSAFPKVAALDHFTDGTLTVRAVSVPKWHPTLALTGATCLTVASVIPHTIPHEVARESGCAGARVAMETPNGVVVGSPALSAAEGGLRLAWVSVSGKRARYIERISLDRFPVADHAVEELVA